ncbi:MAG: GNAT family N-acetyltransferase [Kastovskya adunca ATA6-11-RM4]|jgi:RimJ/RimL family protein N-acetyltransferase|nr:GNAT family N-acetyltransferase [Kastovskya adunca ATA6-11-RM4]
MTSMQSKNLHFEPLTAAHADDLFAVLTTPSVLAFIDPTGKPPTLEELRAEYAARASGPVNLITPTEKWFNVAVHLKADSSKAIGRLEATRYSKWGEVAYLLGEAWWGKGLAFEAMHWWHDYLEAVVPGTQWWATVHPANQRSIRLLTRLKYEEVDSSRRPKLQSYDLGDRCFIRSDHVKEHTA